jgi:hypothetical protein
VKKGCRALEGVQAPAGGSGLTPWPRNGLFDKKERVGASFPVEIDSEAQRKGDSKKSVVGSTMNRSKVCNTDYRVVKPKIKCGNASS